MKRPYGHQTTFFAANGAESSVETCLACGKTFPHRRAPNKYCLDCGEDRARWRRDTNARQTMRRILVRRDFLGILTSAMIAQELEATPLARWARRERTDKQLAELERLLTAKTANDPTVRAKVRSTAALIAQTRDGLTQNQRARAMTLLSDVGSEWGQDEDRMLVYAAEALFLYRTIPRQDRDARYHARLAGSMLRFANVCAARREGYRTAGNMARGAYHILKEKCNSSDAFVMRLLHQADVRAVRLMGEGRRDERLLEKQRREMIDLSETISSLEIRRETARELAGYWERYGEPDVAMEQVNVLSTLRPTLSDHQGMDEPTFLRPRIEWFLASPRKQDKQEAGRLIKEEFIPLYRTDRQGYTPMCCNDGAIAETLRN
jgi:hypothetical protein